MSRNGRDVGCGGRCTLHVGTLREAARRGRTLSGVPKTFFIRTFGCQMNEHDSERLAGLLVADGLVPTTEESEADVVVLNTCCIRENADQKLY
ncbi:MAG TPA: hypothetical protein VGF87_02430, partial [Acidimicrobiales bacterium]